MVASVSPAEGVHQGGAILSQRPNRARSRHGLILSIVILLPIIPPTSARAGEEAVIAEARQLLYTNRGRSMVLLEEAVERSPHDVAAWAELVHALDVDGADDFAERASRTGLRLHPNEPSLLLARARLLPTGPALDVLAQLGKLPGHEREASELSERLALDIAIPGPHYPGFPYGVWADRLIALDRLERAHYVINAGLKADPKPQWREELLAMRGVVLALEGRFDECLDAQRAARGLQYQISGRWTGAADVLLSKDEPELAVRSFAGRTASRKRAADTPDHANAARRHVLAMALVRTGKPADAAALLVERDRHDQLLLVRTHVLAGENEEARAVAARLVAPLQSGPADGNDSGSLIEHLHGELSVERDYVAAVRWVREQFPDKAWGIDHALGAAGDRPRRSKGFSHGMLPSSQRIPVLEASLAKADANAAHDLRRELTRAYEEAGLFARAAACVAPLAKDPGRRYAEPFNTFAMRWAVLRRHVTTEQFFQSDPQTLASSRFLLSAPRAREYNQRPIPGHPFPDDEEIVAKLRQMGPGVLAPVVDAVGPNRISSSDLSPFVRVVAALEDEGDAPILIYVLARMNADAKGRLPTDAAAVNARAATLAALRKALPSLTSARPPAGDDETEFWNAWWTSNAARIIGAGQP